MSTVGMSAVLNARDRRTQRITTALFAVFLFYLVVSSTKSNAELFESFGLWFAHGFHLRENLQALFAYDGGVYRRWLLNTVGYSVASAAGASVFASMAGYAFAKFEFAGKRTLFGLILGAVLVPHTALVIPLFLLLSQTGLVNTPLAVVLPSMVSPFGLYQMRVYADRAVPDELLVVLLTFVAAWNNYFLPLVVLSDPRYFPLTVGLASWYQQASSGSGAEALFSLVLTGALVGILPVLVLFLFLQRYWQSGLSAGSLK